MTDLKPCPFCGSTTTNTIKRPPYMTWLKECGICGATGGAGRTEEEAEQNWDRRVESELAEAMEQIRLDSAVCICGCPNSEHESYGEDGESCAVIGDHQCIRVCPGVLEIANELRAQLAEARKDLGVMVDDNVQLINSMSALKAKLADAAIGRQRVAITSLNALLATARAKIEKIRDIVTYKEKYRSDEGRLRAVCEILGEILGDEEA